MRYNKLFDLEMCFHKLEKQIDKILCDNKFGFFFSIVTE